MRLSLQQTPQKPRLAHPKSKQESNREKEPNLRSQVSTIG